MCGSSATLSERSHGMHEAGQKVVCEEPYTVVVYLFGAKGDLYPGWYIRVGGQIQSGGPYESSIEAEMAFKESD